MIKSEYITYGFILLFILSLVYIIYKNPSHISLSQNIHHYLSYDINTEKINCYSDNTFYRKLKSVYMSQTVKTNLVTTINDFIKNSNKFKQNNIPRSLRIILSGQEGIGKRTLIEALATEINHSIIHFPKNEYSEKMLHTFFMNINNIIISNNIIVFDNIDFNYIYQNNSHLYILLSELIIKNDKKNIFIFIFNDIKSILPTFASNFHIHHHYHMDANIKYIMNMIKDNILDDQNKNIKLKNIKNTFLKLNHKITPGYIFPYLLFSENFEKSLDRFLKIVNN